MRGVFCRRYLNTRFVQGRGGRDDNEEDDQNCEDGSDPDIRFVFRVVVRRDAFLDHRRLHVDLHVRRDRRTDHRDERKHKRVFETKRRFHQTDRDRGPIRPRKKRRDDVAEKDEGHQQEHFLDLLVRALHHQPPHQNRRERHRR